MRQIYFKPNSFTEEKNEEYHINYAAYCVNTINVNLHNEFLSKCFINSMFYRGKQWIFEEDLEQFLMDNSGEHRNRIRFIRNIVKPTIRHLLGNAIIADFSFKAVSSSEMAVNRRNTQFERNLFMFDTMKELEGTGLDSVIKDTYNIGDDVDETIEKFNNTYTDTYAKKINMMLRSIDNTNDIKTKLKYEVAENVALCGLGVAKTYPYRGTLRAESVDVKRFFFDRSANKKDLSDAMYMGEYHLMSSVDILERWRKISRDKVAAIEEIATQGEYFVGDGYIHSVYDRGTARQNRIPVYEVYWKDVERKEYGYVIDEYGEPCLKEINSKDSKYKDKDLTTPPVEISEEIKYLLGGKKKFEQVDQELRYCIFIPSEFVGSNYKGDIVLEYGKVPYQYRRGEKVNHIYKCATWSYIDGEILTIIDDIISPQRFINRMMSIMESVINSSGGAGTIIDADTVRPEDGGEESVSRKMKMNEPIYLNANGNLNNAVGRYDMTIGSSANVLITIADQMTRMQQETTGVNESMTGSAAGYSQLVGVNKINLQQGNVMQENFYFAIGDILHNIFRDAANRGKYIYSESRKKLSYIIGDSWTEHFYITREESLEDYDIFIERTLSPEEERQYVDGLLLTLLQAGLIDRKRYAKLFKSGSREDVALAIKEHSNELDEAEKLQAEREAQNQERMNLMQQAALEEERMNRVQGSIEKEKDRQAGIEKELLKGVMNQGKNS